VKVELQELDLRKEFPPPSLEEWKQAVVASLKGADFDKVMRTKTYEGITLKPIYTKEDVAGLGFTDALPGEAPHQRGNAPQGFASQGWKVAQAQTTQDLAALNREILDELSRGLSAVNLVLKHDDFPAGIELRSAEDLATALKGVDLKAAPLMVQMDMDDPDLFSWLEEFCAQTKQDLSQLDGCLGFDPTGEFARKGFLNLPLEDVWSWVGAEVARRVEKAPRLRCLSIDATVYASSGASAVQELAFALSTAIGYIQGLQASGLEIDKIAPLFQVKFSLGSNLFMEIAKIRAFRMLWSEMVKAFGGNDESRRIWIHGKTSTFNKSGYDLYVNMLRTSTEGFAGVVAGVDSLEIDRFDATLDVEATEFSKRLARNQQLILAEEAHLSRVADPAGGCYYIESLTADLASQAWKMMQELEAGGGMIRGLKAGTIHTMIDAVAQARIDAVHKRRDVFVGVNMYANPDDALPALAEASVDDSKAAVRLERGALPKRRAVEALEQFRSNMAAYGKKVFLITMGSLAEYKARADFATGFLQVGGFIVVEGTGYTDVQSAVEAARDYEAVCICSTDDKYPELVPALCAKLTDKIKILAGYPADQVEAHKQSGIDVFIHLRANLLDTLQDLAARMGVQK
jgi:methylmalonyl-CoA mutase